MQRSENQLAKASDWGLLKLSTICLSLVDRRSCPKEVLIQCREAYLNRNSEPRRLER